MFVPNKDSLRVPPDQIRRYARLALIVAIAVAVIGVGGRLVWRAILGHETAEIAIPNVATVRSDGATGGDDLVLPGNVQAYNQAAIYARVSGYLKNWQTDIGTPVTKDQVLAEIDAPELDQQLRQAQADLATAQANYRLADRTNVRWQALLATDSVSKQDADEKAGDAAAKKALVDSASANVERLKELQSFKRVVAPFDGTVVARNTDIGALINGGQGTGTELFRVADTRKLRIYVFVPQPYAGAAKPGTMASLHFAEHADKSYPATIVRTANALDPASRTLQVELEVDNAAGELFPGAYAEVHFSLAANGATQRLPVTTLLFRPSGLQVAVVGADNHVHLKTVTPGRDFGTTIEILAGVDKNDNVIVNPPDSLAEGDVVRVVATPAKPGAPSEKTAKKE